MKKGEFCWVDHGNGICNAVYVGNVIDMCLKCCINPKADKQAFIATDGEEITWCEFYSHYLDVIGMKPEQFQSVPLVDDTGRKILKAWRNALQKRIDSLWEKVEATEPTQPTKARLLYRAPRKMLRIIQKQIIKRLPEMNATEKAIYSQSVPVNVQKNKEVLGYQPRYSVEKGMEITCEWLKWSDLYNPKN